MLSWLQNKIPVFWDPCTPLYLGGARRVIRVTLSLWGMLWELLFCWSLAVTSFTCWSHVASEKLWSSDSEKDRPIKLISSRMPLALCFLVSFAHMWDAILPLPSSDVRSDVPTTLLVPVLYSFSIPSNSHSSTAELAIAWHGHFALRHLRSSLGWCTDALGYTKFVNVSCVLQSWFLPK